MLLNTADCGWLLLLAAGCYWSLLAAAGCCRIAAARILVVDDCWSRLGYYLVIAAGEGVFEHIQDFDYLRLGHICMRKSL